MVRPALIAAACVLLSASPALAAGPSPYGDWSRGDGKARVKIENCGDDLCAINTWIKPGTPDEKVGDKLVMTVKEGEGGKWTGKAFDPQRHMTYRFTMTVHEETMTTSGCVLGGILCKSMNWKKIEG